MLTRRGFLGLCAGTLGSLALDPTDAFGWGAFAKFAPTHQNITSRAYDLLMNDVGVLKAMMFPAREEILKYDWVFGNHVDGIYGNGPDADDKTPYSWHYYNPQKGWGRGPYAVAKNFQELVQGLRTDPGGIGTAHAASWASHFIADMHVPYHVVGLPAEEAHRRYQRGDYNLYDSESGPLCLYGSSQPSSGWGYQQNFQYALGYFCKNYPLTVQGEPNSVDWFDPWYFNGYVFKTANGSHASWEADAYLHWDMQGTNEILNIICSQSYYDPLWKNVKLIFGQDFWEPATQHAAQFAEDRAFQTIEKIKEIYESPFLGIAYAIRSVATLFRASMSALTLEVKTTDLGGGKVNVLGIITNQSTIPNDDALDVDVRLMLHRNGNWRGEVKKTGAIPPGQYKQVEWEVDTTSYNGEKAHMDVSGIYQISPDLGYVFKQFLLKANNIFDEDVPYGFNSYLDSLSADNYLNNSTVNQPVNIEGQKEALKNSVVSAYSNSWNKVFCGCTQEEAKKDFNCVRRAPSGCIVGVKEPKDNLLHRIKMAKTPEDLDALWERFNCLDRCFKAGDKKGCPKTCP